MRIVCISAIFLIAIAVSFPAAAARFDGAYLMQLCDMDENGGEKVKGGHAACQSYISGVIDYHNVLRSLRIAPQIDICVPHNITMNELHEIVLEYMRKHPENDAFVAAPGVTMALYSRYPCRR